MLKKYKLLYIADTRTGNTFFETVEKRGFLLPESTDKGGEF